MPADRPRHSSIAHAERQIDSRQARSRSASNSHFGGLDRLCHELRGNDVGHGGMGGGLANARVATRSSHDGKTQKTVRDRSASKKRLRLPWAWTARFHISSASSQTV